MRRILLASSLLALTGCYGGRVHHPHGGGDVAFAAGAGLLAGVALAEAAHDHDHDHEHEHERRPDTVYVHQAAPVVYVSAPPASARDQVPTEDAPGFDAKSARAALGRVDLAACRGAGAPRGYGHAKVTFNPDGAASKVVVDTPDGLSAVAVKCIGDRLGAVNVPAYQGNYVTVGTTWFVP